MKIRGVFTKEEDNHAKNCLITFSSMMNGSLGFDIDHFGDKNRQTTRSISDMESNDDGRIDRN